MWSEEYCVVCNSGTDALTLAALAMGISEASVQSDTLALTAIGLHRGGVDVKIVDIDEDGRVQSDAEDAVPVLLFAVDCRVGSVSPVIRRSHAHGCATTETCHACWSFYPNQNARCPGR